MLVYLHQEGRGIGLANKIRAYALQDVNLPYNSASALTGPYVVPAFAMDVRVVLTNKTPAGTYRAPGRYESTFVRERLLDAIAAKVGVSEFAETSGSLLYAGIDLPSIVPESY